TSAAEALGYHPQVILAGRRLNDDMGRFVAAKAIKLLIESGASVRGARVGILGLTFKENVPDIRNSKVPDIVKELREFGITPIVHDPLASSDTAHGEYGFALAPLTQFHDLDAVILAVNHRAYLELGGRLFSMVKAGGVVVDVKSAIDRTTVPDTLRYWSL
ncbi:MAG: UDP binding domain-containing protein, partial [Aestuariivirga sp.]